MNYENLFTCGFFSWRWPQHWPHNISQFFRNIKYIYQRAKRGYSDVDVWEMSSFITHVIIGMLTQLKENHLGYPFGYTDEQWKSILSEMIEHFNNADECNDNIPLVKESEALCEEIVKLRCSHANEDDLSNEEKELLDKMHEEWSNMLKEIHSYRTSEVTKAFEMLSKYYWNLWD